MNNNIWIDKNGLFDSFSLQDGGDSCWGEATMWQRNDLICSLIQSQVLGFLLTPTMVWLTARASKGSLQLFNLFNRITHKTHTQ